MVFQVPTYTAPATSWQLVDWIDRSLVSEKAGADGLATLTAPQLDSGTMWLIDHAVIQCTGAKPTTFRLYVGAATAQNLRDGSSEGSFDVADWPNGLLLRSSGVLIGQWSGAAVGAVGTLTLQARVFLQG